MFSGIQSMYRSVWLGHLHIRMRCQARSMWKRFFSSKKGNHGTQYIQSFKWTCFDSLKWWDFTEHRKFSKHSRLHKIFIPLSWSVPGSNDKKLSDYYLHSFFRDHFRPQNDVLRWQEVYFLHGSKYLGSLFLFDKFEWRTLYFRWYTTIYKTGSF